MKLESTQLRYGVLLLLCGVSFATTAQNNSLLVESNRQQLLQTLACPGCDLRGTDLAGKNLSGADLQSADLANANLTATDLRGAKLTHANLRDAIIIDTRLSGADLRNADFGELDIDESFESLEIIGAQLEGAKFKDGVICGKAPAKGGWGCQHQ